MNFHPDYKKHFTSFKLKRLLRPVPILFIAEGGNGVCAGGFDRMVTHREIGD